MFTSHAQLCMQREYYSIFGPQKARGWPARAKILSNHQNHCTNPAFVLAKAGSGPGPFAPRLFPQGAQRAARPPRRAGGCVRQRQTAGGMKQGDFARRRRPEGRAGRRQRAGAKKRRRGLAKGQDGGAAVCNGECRPWRGAKGLAEGGRTRPGFSSPLL